MARGIIYVMSTVVPGLVKIGKTGTDKYESRMYALERNGYFNVTGLKREFAIEVDDYDEKESMLDEIFSRSRVPNSELFALDIDLIIQLLSSFDGKTVYPQEIDKETIFEEATEERDRKKDWEKLPDGLYHISENRKKFGHISATMRVDEGVFTVEKGSICLPSNAKWKPEARRNAPIKNNILQADVDCNSPSTAAWVVMGNSSNGWLLWKDADNDPIDLYRKGDKTKLRKS